MKPAAIIVESELEREIREERNRRTDRLLAAVEREQERGARWNTAKEMLGYFFAMFGRMESAPAIDPAREVIQGLQVDRDERIHWQARIYQALKLLAKRQGNDRGVLLLWLHFRAPREVAMRTEKDGRRHVVYGDHSLAIRDLHTEAGGSRDSVIQEFWRAFELLEEFALEKGWVSERLERRPRNVKVGVYRRQE